MNNHEKKYVCAMCSAEFETEEEHEQHMKEEHSGEEKTDESMPE